LRYPLEFELLPKEMDPGIHWVTLQLKNVGTKTLKGLEVNLNSLDSQFFSVLGTGKYLLDLKPKEVEVVPFQVSATATTKLYASVSGTMDGANFYRESPTIRVKVGKAPAELKSLFTMTEPYPPLGESLRCEATLLGLEKSEGLDLEFWAEIPSGKFEELARIETKRLSTGEETTFSAEITPKEEGFYTIHAYLYHDNRRIGHETDSIWVKK
jgi:hypothetical protein